MFGRSGRRGPLRSGLNGDELEALILGADLERLTRGQAGWAQRLLSWRRWPFAPARPYPFAQFVGDIIGPEKTFAQLAKPFATLGIDIVSGDFLV
jgi:hypothetical protein